MSIITNNKVTRAVKWPYENRGKLLVLAFIGMPGAMAYDDIKPLDVCEAIALDFKNAGRIKADSPEAVEYRDGRLKNAENALHKYNCNL